MPTLISGSTGVNKITDGTIVNADIASGAAIAGSKISGSFGKVLQVVSLADTTAVNSTSTTFADVYSLAITPSATSSKILLLTTNHIYVTQQTDDNWRGCLIRILRDSTVISTDDAKYGEGAYMANNNDRWMTYSTRHILDSPNTTSAVTYKIQFASKTSTQVTLNNADSYGSGGHLTLMEIGA